MSKSLLGIIFVIALIAAAACLTIGLIAAIGAFKVTDGCLYRYDFDAAGAEINADRVTNTVTLRADGNYTALYTQNADETIDIKLDPDHYGEWLNTNLNISAGQKVKVKITGDVSLCRAYLPANNLQTTANVDVDGKRIPVPRVEEGIPLSLMMDATVDEWRNITEMFKNDRIIVSISPDKKAKKDTNGNIISDVQAVTFYDVVNKNSITEDCREGNRTYSPICGRYSIYSGNYTKDCAWNSTCYRCNCHEVCEVFDFFGTCAFGASHEECDDCGCWDNLLAIAPEPYRYDGYFTSPWSDNLSHLFINLNLNCSDPVFHNIGPDYLYIKGDFQNKRYFWFSADSATGLLYRLDTSEEPANKKARGANFNFAQIMTDQSTYANSADYKIIWDQVFVNNNKTYLQFRLHDNDAEFAGNTGGYVLNIKHTKCRRKNGSSFTDVFSDRGSVQYVIVAGGNPNVAGSPTHTPITLTTDEDGNAQFQGPADAGGYVWMRIANNSLDYKDSFGQYLVQFFTSIERNSFTLNILSPLFDNLKGKIKDTVEIVFKRMVCYQGAGTSCSNFFTYIKGLLILYIMSYGMMFLLGMVEISQTDLVIRVIKIGIVSGLMSEKTFDWFNFYLFDFITGFADQVISNISGYSLFSSKNNITNPFMFMDAIMSKIFFSKTFAIQLLAVISMGITGVIYFIIIFIALAIMIITAFRAISIYLMAFLALALLVGTAPLFLTFMLFDFTKYLFENWVRFTFRYMIEPVVLMAGIIILTQLFTIYMDIVLGYSVCWKCALPIKIPFPKVPIFPPAFANVEMFCINWFAPWGLDSRAGMMGINLQHIIALVMIAYCMYGYADLAGKMVFKLTSTAGPSATQMGQGMSNSFENAALSKVGLDKESRSKMQSEASQRLDDKAAAAKEKGGNNRQGINDSGRGDSKENNKESNKASGENENKGSKSTKGGKEG